VTNAGASKVYTKAGDKGKTSLIGGARVSKAELRLDAYGTIDELNSVLGILHAEVASDLAVIQPRESESVSRILHLIQHDLFEVGSHLACEDAVARANLPCVNTGQVTMLERAMDAYSAELSELKHFVLPGGARSAAFAHLARTVCRRAERLCVRLDETAIGEKMEASTNDSTAEVDAVVIQYLNRLSDYLFVLSRHLNRLLGVDEPIWRAKS
jgi:cob(I)alamin adenosyltransferase